MTRVRPDYDVIVVGAGPSGLLLAAELSRLGFDVALMEQRASGEARSRAIGLHPPVLAALEASGATERILAHAVRIPRGIARTNHGVLGEVRFDRLRTRFPFVATAAQAVTEAAVAHGGPALQRSTRVTGLLEIGDLVRASISTPHGTAEVSARIVVIAAGAAGRSLVPPAFGVRAHTYGDRYIMTDITEAPTQPADTAVITLDREGVLESFPLSGGGRRLVAWDRMLSPDDLTDAEGDAGAPTDTERLIRAVAVRGGDASLAATIERSSSFGIRRVLVRRMRKGRVFVIGDAAHEISPIGGQGMNLGLLDAVTLAPRIADWLRDVDHGNSHDPAIANGLARWERARLTSSRIAAQLAGMNTALGRPRRAAIHAFAKLALGAALSDPIARLPARAYAMGFDRAARRSL